MAFIGPWLLGLVLLYAYPFAASLYWSFTRYDLLNPPEPIGTQHYQRLAHELASGTDFGQATWNTAYYALTSVPLSIVLCITLATMLSWRVRGQAVFRTLFFLPSVVPVVATAILWMWLLDPQTGLVNHLLESIGLAPQGWFTDGERLAFWPGSWFSVSGFGFGAKDGLVLMSLWGVGNFMVIYLAAIANVPRSLYEAAEIDGAGRWTRFRRITLPMLSPVIFFNLIMGLIQSVQAFTQVYLVSEGRGAPGGSTLMLSLHLFLAAFQNLEMGYASAMAWILFLALATATICLFRSSRHWVHYQGVGP
jgi:multiple sugar transport system permease protein